MDRRRAGGTVRHPARAPLRGDERWPPGFPLAVAAAGLVPIVAHRLGLWTTLPGPAIAVASIAAATAAWWVANRVIGTERAARFIAAISAWATIAGLTFALGGTALAVAANRPSDMRQPARLIVGPLVAPRDRLFDLTRDPAERTNRAAADSAATERLRTELTTWHDTARLAARQARAASMTEEHKAALRAPGYLAE